MSFCFLILVALSITHVVALAVPTNESNNRAATPNSVGLHDGYYYRFWSDGQPNMTATYTNLPGGGYSLQWSGDGDIFGGKGWSPGTKTRYGTIFHPRHL